MMKLALVLAATATVSMVKAQDSANPSGMPNVVYFTSWDDWIWCCTDSGGLCPDACARVNQQAGQYWYDNWGPGSDIYIEQSTIEAPPSNDIPPGGFIDPDFVSNKCIMVHGLVCCGLTGVCGDPHFKTWGGDYYDYQGQCELKFLSAPDFGSGIGLDIHLRTKIKSSYSFVESAAIKIGNDVLEVGSWGEYFINGVESVQMPVLLGGFPVNYYQRSEKEHVFDIFLGDDRRILIKNLKEWVSVHIDKPSDVDFVTSVGMMGDFMTGARLARDGKTVIKDENEFGQEWQVQPDELQLFVSKEWEPTHESKCVLPDVMSEEAIAAQRRLLEENGITKEKAEAACAHYPAHQEFCVRDVLAAGDLDVANAF